MIIPIPDQLGIHFLKRTFLQNTMITKRDDGQHQIYCSKSQYTVLKQRQFKSFLRKVFILQLFKNYHYFFLILKQSDLSSDEKGEESFNRTALVMSCLTRLIFVFPYSQKQTIMFLFTMITLKNINVTLAQRALKYVSPTYSKTMCYCLPYVVKTTVKWGRKIEVRIS